jgi:hypothetical protein
MADVTILDVAVPATEFDLVTLEECKIGLGLSLTSVDPLLDQQLAFLISTQSAVVAGMCNTVFAKETLTESWREIETSSRGRRVFLTHWPVKNADVETVTISNAYAALIPGEWELEEKSGKLSYYVGYDEPAVITYTGGYLLPDEAPPALKQATIAMVREQRRQIMLGNLEGIRSLSHKSARVQFYDPTKLMAMGVGGTAAEQAVSRLLRPFIRYWV